MVENSNKNAGQANADPLEGQTTTKVGNATGENPGVRIVGHQTHLFIPVSKVVSGTRHEEMR